MRAPLRQPLALAGDAAAKAKIIAELLIIARIFALNLEGRFEPQSTKAGYDDVRINTFCRLIRGGELHQEEAASS
jgi:hypothetical protein